MVKNTVSFGFKVVVHVYEYDLVTDDRNGIPGHQREAHEGFTVHKLLLIQMNNGGTKINKI